MNGWRLSCLPKMGWEDFPEQGCSLSDSSYSFACLLFLPFLKSSTESIFLKIAFSEKGREEGRERNYEVRNTNWLSPACSQAGDHVCPDLGSNLKPRQVPCPGIIPATLQLQDNAPTSWATLVGCLLTSCCQGPSHWFSPGHWFQVEPLPCTFPHS